MNFFKKSWKIHLIKLSKWWSKTEEEIYLFRLLTCWVVVLLVIIFIIYFFPQNLIETNQSLVQTPPTKTYSIIEHITVTKHQQKPPPPAANLPPVKVPNDPIIEITLDLPIHNYKLSSLSDKLNSLQSSTSHGIIAAPEIPPQLIHVVSPSIKAEELTKRNIRATIYMIFLVDTNGKIKTASIEDIFFLDSYLKPISGSNTIDADLQKLCINAAMKWRFKPAKHQGKNVLSYHRDSFNLGF